ILTASYCAAGVQVQSGADDRKQMEGKWNGVSYLEADGKALTGKDLQMSVEFSKDKFVVKDSGGIQLEGTWNLDATKRPKEIDMKVNDATLVGIYEANGETLKLFFDGTGKERPTSFKDAPKPGSGQRLVVLKRNK